MTKQPTVMAMVQIAAIVASHKPSTADSPVVKIITSIESVVPKLRSVENLANDQKLSRRPWRSCDTLAFECFTTGPKFTNNDESLDPAKISHTTVSAKPPLAAPASSRHPSVASTVGLGMPEIRDA